jgi:hypothetical protein
VMSWSILKLIWHQSLKVKIKPCVWSDIQSEVSITLLTAVKKKRFPKISSHPEQTTLFIVCLVKVIKKVPLSISIISRWIEDMSCNIECVLIKSSRGFVVQDGRSNNVTGLAVLLVVLSVRYIQKIKIKLKRKCVCAFAYSYYRRRYFQSN